MGRQPGRNRKVLICNANRCVKPRGGGWVRWYYCMGWAGKNLENEDKPKSQPEMTHAAAFGKTN